MDDFVPDYIEPDCADYIRSIFLAGAHDLGAGLTQRLGGRAVQDKPTLTRCHSARQHNPRPTIHLTTRRGGSQCRRR